MFEIPHMIGTLGNSGYLRLNRGVLRPVHNLGELLEEVNFPLATKNLYENP